MNRRQMRYGMRVAVLSRYGAPARKAKVHYIDSSDGYAAVHTLTLVDDDWNPLKDSQGQPVTVKVASRKIKKWEQVQEGVEERQFIEEKNRIQAKLNQEAAAKAEEPWTRFDDLLQLHGIDQIKVKPGYGTPPMAWTITVPAASAEDFLNLFIPYLTQRLFDRTPVVPD